MKFLDLSHVLILGATALAAMVAGSTQASLNLGNPESEARAACIAFEANGAGFTRYKCRYTITKAEAKSPDDGFRGVWTGARKCDFLFVRDGDKSRFEAFAPKVIKKPIRALTKGELGGMPIDFLPIAEVRKGDIAAVHSALMQSLYVHSPEMEVQFNEPTPLPFWSVFEPVQIRLPIRRIERVAAGRDFLRSVELIRVDESLTWTVRFGNEIEDDIQFDVQRGL